MADWSSEIRARLAGMGLTPEREAAIVDELAQHLRDRERELRQRGSSAEDARRRTLDDIADDARLRTELARLRISRESSSPAPGAPSSSRLASIAQDLRQGVRALRQRPAFTTAAVLALAIGVGATSAIFGAVDTVLLRPMPFRHADRLYVPVSVNLARHVEKGGSISFADYDDWRQQTDIFANVALFRTVALDMSADGGDPDRIDVAQVTEDFFPLVDLVPVAGRTLVPADHVVGAPLVAVISYGLWQARFGGAADALSRTIRIAGVPARIVGVLPATGVFPETSKMFLPLKPAGFTQDVRTRRDNLIFQSLARLEDGVTASTANARLGAIAQRVERDNPVTRKGWTNKVIPLRESLVDDNLRAALSVLLGAVAGVLLIACANVANLSLVRGSGRTRELAVRLSLGASRRRLIQQLMIEGVLLSVAGSGLGVGLAVLAMKGLVIIAPDGTPFLSDLHMNTRVLEATIAFGAIAAILSSLLPAWSMSDVQLSGALRDGTAGSGTSRGGARLRHVLVIAEVAAAVVLLSGSALLIHSFARLGRVDPGVDLDRALAGRISVPAAAYKTDAARATFGQTLVAKLEASPGIERAALSTYVPVGAGGFDLDRVFLAEGRPEPPAGPEVSAEWTAVTPDYFATIGIPVREGRAFDDHDTATTAPVMIVSASFAREMFPSGTAIGQRVRSWRDENIFREIVGVVDDVKLRGLADQNHAIVYVPHTQCSWGNLMVVVRTSRGDPAALAPTVRAALRSVDGNLAIADLRPLATSAARSVSDRRYATLLLSLLALVALGLAGLGIYGVTSHVFALRRREMGIRLALGATRAHVYGLVLRHGLGLVATGLVLGAIGAALSTRLITALLYATTTADAPAWTSMIVVVALSATIACVIPAYRAAHADPTMTLRGEQ